MPHRSSLFLKNKFYRDQDHPYRVFERVIRDFARENDVVLDIGCGREALLSRSLASRCRQFIGVDLVDFTKEVFEKVFLLKSNAESLCVRDEAVDLVISRSVLEHIERPEVVFQEVYRTLKVYGKFIFLTPNLYDYGTLASRIIPNRFHKQIVKLTEGRREEDTFPTFYRANTARSIRKVAALNGFRVLSIRFLGQYPSYFMFNPLVFLMGTAYDRIVCKRIEALRGWLLAVTIKNKR